MRPTASPRGCTASSITWGEHVRRAGPLLPPPLLLLPPAGSPCCESLLLSVAVHDAPWASLLASSNSPAKQQTSSSKLGCACNERQIRRKESCSIGEWKGVQAVTCASCDDLAQGRQRAGCLDELLQQSVGDLMPRRLCLIQIICHLRGSRS